MGKYKIKLYSNAKMNLKDIVSYLNILSPQSAIKYYDTLQIRRILYGKRSYEGLL
ncbi:MAG: hypothetical protein WA113_07000 [Desulfitobacteriaceae bacterium]